MPLIHSKSKKAFSKNIETEMNHGKPQPQALAIAYSVKRKAKKHMAEGGDPSISAKSEKRPMPSDKHSDSADVRQNSGNKAPGQDSWTDTPTLRQAQRPSRTQLSQPRMVESGVIRTKLRSDEHNLMDKDAPGSPKEEPAKTWDEEGANRQGPESRDLHMKRMANGGKIDPDHSGNKHNKAEDHEYGGMAEEDNQDEPHGLMEDDDQERLPVDEYMAGHFAEGGRAGGEMDSYDDDGHEDSITAAIMARRNRLHDEIDSGAHDEDAAAMYAEGGEILSHGSMDSDDSDQADLSRNADEDANEEDQSSFNALRKENYSESEGLRQLDQPDDSNEHGDKREDDREDRHDRVSAIRSKMSQRRQFKQR